MPCDGDCSQSVVGRPFPLFGGTLLGPNSLVPLNMKNRSYTMHEMTPLYTGQAVSQNVTYYGQGSILSKAKHQTVKVGGFTEAFAFSSSPPIAGLPEGASSGILTNATLTEEGTTVEDMAGISSWALADFISTLLPLVRQHVEWCELFTRRIQSPVRLRFEGKRLRHHSSNVEPTAHGWSS